MVDWLRAVDLYCERLGPEFWAEPLNALSNVFLLLPAVFGFSQTELFSRNRWFRALAIAAFLTAIGSFSFHTFANFLTLWLDVLPILVLMLIFFGYVLRKIFRVSKLITGLSLLAFSVAGVLLQVSPLKTILNGSFTYIHAVLVLVGMLGSLIVKRSRLVRLFSLIVIVFFLSLVFRTFDHQFCVSWPYGTHFVWHTLNGLVIFLLLNVVKEHEKETTRP